MSISRVKTWNPGDILTAADLNGEFNNIVNNGTQLAFPLTANVTGGGFTLSNITVKVNDLTNGNAAALIKTSVALNDGTAAQTATLTNGPIAGNPTKWIPINDNGTVRYIPSW